MTTPPQPAWNDQNLHHPHDVADKAKRVEAMFAAIAPSYDLNNRVHSLGRDKAWRRAAVKLAWLEQGDVVLDVASGTGDLALALARTKKPGRIIGIDFTFNMLQVATRKAAHEPSAIYHPPSAITHPSPHNRLSFHCADALRLPIADASVDVVSIAFGIRNVTDPARAMAEFARVLRPGGRLVILEFSLPTNRVVRALYNFYFRQVMPRTASWIARDKTGAYRYLPQSVNTFIGRRQMIDLMQQVGLTYPSQRPLTFGIAVLYRGIKPKL